jgi:glyoxalase family protein
MKKWITGLHHVTAIAGDAQGNVDFYGGILGLRMVKKTVNFEDSNVYHLYFGDERGMPGSVMTTFPYGRDLAKGRHGKGMLNTTAFSIPLSGLDFWLDRLDRFDIGFKHPQQRFGGEVFVYLEDPDGLGIELVFTEKDQRVGYSNGSIPAALSIRGFHHIEIWLESVERTAALLTTHMSHELLYDGGSRLRLGVEDRPGAFVDLIAMPGVLKGLGGRGTVHHVAFATPDSETQLELRDRLIQNGLLPSEVKNRKYFNSIYFREPGGVLFEVATSGPGFSVDEELASLGEGLMLPPQFEHERERLLNLLPKLSFPNLSQNV